MSDGEEDQLYNAPGLTPDSRLSCQAVADGSADLVIFHTETGTATRHGSSR